MKVVSFSMWKSVRIDFAAWAAGSVRPKAVAAWAAARWMGRDAGGATQLSNWSRPGRSG